jgi:cysteine-rich repeat protein
MECAERTANATTCLSCCGNGITESPEECDDGNKIDDDSCSNTCCKHPPGEGRACGDPHFKTWRGQSFDFHGECDLILLHTSSFMSGLGLDVHIRTKIRRAMSYITSAALRIGTDVFEVDSQGVYYLNGVAGADLPSEFGGFKFWHTQPTDKLHVFEVHLGGRERIKVKTYKDFASVLIEQGQNKHFGDSVGLMGDFGMGDMIARDSKTVIDDANHFGQEWQVLDTELSLFQTDRLPQHPQLCTMPTPVQASQLRRRLLESSVNDLAAEKACEHWGEGNNACVFDVLMTGDLGMALVGGY